MSSTELISNDAAGSPGSVGHVSALDSIGNHQHNSAFSEHPLTAATTAMLNINGATDDSPGFNVFYDIYGKMTADANLIKSERNISADIWSPVQVSSGGKLSNGDMSEVFVSSGHSPLNSTKLNSVLRRGDGGKLKLTHNGHRYTNGDPLSPDGGGGGVIIVKEELPHSPGGTSSPRMNGILGVSTPQPPQASVSPSEEHNPYPSGQLFATLNSSHYGDSYVSGQGVVVSSPSSQQFATSLRSAGNLTLSGASGIYAVASPGNEAYYRDYFPDNYGQTGVSNATRVISGYDGPTSDGANNGATATSFIDRYGRTATVVGPYKNPVTIDVNSPDSGIGAESITPRDHSTIQPGFDYNDICHTGLISDISGASSNAGSATGRTTPGGTVQKSTRPWHEFGRTSEADKIQIPKLFSNYGFRYYLESPISTSQRREDDRITYINKGQFYGITLECVPDPEKPLKSQTVKSVVMLVFREEKSPEDEIKAWQFWHSRQHSVKQRILDADTKNSVGLVGCIDEVAHNAIAVYWNPLESSAKINVAVQCLSTDFSSQKGVKGLPLHLQIDTYDDPRDPNCPIYHRGYSQIKVFCDKGAERKTRDEERRAAKRKLTATGRKKLDELYHTSCDRTEFYAMSDIAKPPVLFSPAEDLDKLTPLAEFHGYYGGGQSEGSEHSGAASGTEMNQHHSTSSHPHHGHGMLGGGGGSPHSSIGSCGSGSNTPHPHHQPHHQQQQHPPAILKFHNTFPPDSPPHPSNTQGHQYNHPISSIIRPTGSIVASPPPPPLTPTSSHPSSANDGKSLSNGVNNIKDSLESNGSIGGGGGGGGSVGGESVFDSPAIKRMRLMPPSAERLMIYVRQDPEEVFTAVHLVPPTTLGLLSSLEEKFKISMGSVKNLFRRNTKGIMAKVDDEMLKHYCHEDTFSLEVKPSENEDAFDVTLNELTVDIHNQHNQTN